MPSRISFTVPNDYIFLHSTISLLKIASPYRLKKNQTLAAIDLKHYCSCQEGLLNWPKWSKVGEFPKREYFTHAGKGSKRCSCMKCRKWEWSPQPNPSIVLVTFLKWLETLKTHNESFRMYQGWKLVISLCTSHAIRYLPLLTSRVVKLSSLLHGPFSHYHSPKHPLDCQQDHLAWDIFINW